MKHSQTPQVVDGAVVVVAIVGHRKILLIKETTKPTPHYWKLISETMEPGEPILDALVRGVAEEAGLQLEARRGDDGKVVEIIDSRAAAKQLVRSHQVERPRPHRRHFWGVVTSDEVILSLSGKHLTGDVNEEIDTMAFDLRELEGMVDLLPKHRELIKNLMQPA